MESPENEDDRREPEGQQKRAVRSEQDKGWRNRRARRICQYCHTLFLFRQCVRRTAEEHEAQRAHREKHVARHDLGSEIAGCRRFQK